jgi:hypothetical protein
MLTVWYTVLPVEAPANVPKTSIAEEEASIIDLILIDHLVVSPSSRPTPQNLGSDV